MPNIISNFNTTNFELLVPACVYVLDIETLNLQSHPASKYLYIPDTETQTL